MSVYLINAPMIAVLWFLVLVRLSRAMRGRSTPLAAVLALLAIMVTIRLPPVGDLLDSASGVVGMQVLVRDLLGVTLAATAAHTAAQVCACWTRRRPLRTVAWVVAAAAVMIPCFFATGPERAGLLKMNAASGSGPALVYWLVYTAAYGGFLGIVVWCGISDWRTPGKATRGQRGLRLFGMGAAFTEVYLVMKLTTLAAIVLGHADSPLVEYTEELQVAPSALAIIFIVLGAATWTQLHLRERWWLFRLRRSWRRATAPWPAVVLVPAMTWPPEALNRRVHELREATVIAHADGCSVVHLPTEPRALLTVVRSLPNPEACPCQH